MSDILACARRYIQPPLEESDVVVRQLPLYRFLIALDNNIELLWSESDFVLAESYYQLMLSGSEAPAIVVNGCDVYDGYHRLWAWKKLGCREIPAVDLQDIYDKMQEWYGDEW